MQKQSDKFSFSLLTILAALALLVILIVLVTSFVKLIDRSIGGTPYENRDLVAERLEPYGRVNTGNLASGPKAKAPQEIYVSLCASCHDTGLNNAPLMGDNAAWSVRFQERGLEGLHNSALHGRNLMPAKGGDPRLSDEEVIHTVDFILANSGIEVAAEDPAEDIVAEEAPATAEVGDTEAAVEEKVDAEMVEQSAIEEQGLEEAIVKEALTKDAVDTASDSASDMTTDNNAVKNIDKDIDKESDHTVITDKDETRVDEVVKTAHETDQKIDDQKDEDQKGEDQKTKVTASTPAEEVALPSEVEDEDGKSDVKDAQEVDKAPLQAVASQPAEAQSQSELDAEDLDSVDEKAADVTQSPVEMPMKSSVGKATKPEVEQ